MKPMTESEARAALKAEMPWADVIGVVAPGVALGLAYEASASVKRGPVGLTVYAPTLRAAVAKAIRAWRATHKKGAKR